MVAVPVLWMPSHPSLAVREAADAAVGEYVPGRGIGSAALCRRIGAAATPACPFTTPAKSFSHPSHPTLSTRWTMIPTPTSTRASGRGEVVGGND